MPLKTSSARPNRFVVLPAILSLLCFIATGVYGSAEAREISAAFDESAIAPVDVKFHYSGDRGTYLWSFGDGVERIGNKLRFHRYWEAGRYRVVVADPVSREVLARTTVVVGNVVAEDMFETPAISAQTWDWLAGYIEHVEDDDYRLELPFFEDDGDRVGTDDRMGLVAPIDGDHELPSDQLRAAGKFRATLGLPKPDAFDPQHQWVRLKVAALIDWSVWIEWDLASNQTTLTATNYAGDVIGSVEINPGTGNLEIEFANHIKERVFEVRWIALMSDAASEERGFSTQSFDPDLRWDYFFLGTLRVLTGSDTHRQRGVSPELMIDNFGAYWFDFPDE
ncbi:MAG: PKD domain-containing protein [Acidobacteriota bacterium]